jgi:hypothetical protein
MSQKSSVPQVAQSVSKVLIPDNLKGIDFAKDVRLVELKRGTEVMTWAKVDSPIAGKYFSTSIESPAKLGVGFLSVASDGSVASKELAAVSRAPIVADPTSEGHWP